MLWYVLRSKPNKELTLWRELNKRGVECFYPQINVRPVNPRSRTIHPYFPGYLFVHVDMERVGASTFQWMPHSLGLVSYGNEPAFVPDGLVNTIRKQVAEMNTTDKGKQKNFKRGDLVVIRNGPFSGYEALFDQCLDGNERALVFLKLLKARQLNLELPVSQLQRIKVALTNDLFKS